MMMPAKRGGVRAACAGVLVGIALVVAVKEYTSNQTSQIASPPVRSCQSPSSVARRGFLNAATAAGLAGLYAYPSPSNAESSYVERSGRTGQSNIDTANYKSLPNGLRYLDAKVGSGPSVEKGDIVVLEATGRLAGFNGQLFFKATGDGGDPLEFKVGSGLAIPGIDEGVIGMQKGGIRRLIIPGDMGGPGAYPDPGEQRYRQLLFAVVNNDAREDTLVVDLKVDILKK
eukprot:jgi/Bigna1/90930/estExt_fgenesh1_pg.C_830027